MLEPRQVEDDRRRQGDRRAAQALARQGRRVRHRRHHARQIHVAREVPVGAGERLRLLRRRARLGLPGPAVRQREVHRLAHRLSRTRRCASCRSRAGRCRSKTTTCSSSASSRRRPSRSARAACCGGCSSGRAAWASRRTPASSTKCSSSTRRRESVRAEELSRPASRWRRAGSATR